MAGYVDFAPDVALEEGPRSRLVHAGWRLYAFARSGVVVEGLEEDRHRGMTPNPVRKVGDPAAECDGGAPTSARADRTPTLALPAKAPEVRW